MGVVGFDGEQRRTTFGYVAPKNENTQWRPSLEVLYVDNRIGKLAGPQFIFANATLGFNGGFYQKGVSGNGSVRFSESGCKCNATDIRYTRLNNQRCHV